MKKNLKKITFILALIISLFSISFKGFSQFSEPTSNTRIAIHRLFNSYTGRHIVAGAGEGQQLVNAGWSYESKLGYLEKRGTIPVYRFSKSSTGDHYCSTNSTPAQGYTLDGVLGYGATEGGDGRRIVTTYYTIHGFHTNSGLLDHLYSIDQDELNGMSNWTYEGSAFNVYRMGS